MYLPFLGVFFETYVTFLTSLAVFMNLQGWVND
ncbi:hypothetical protein MsAm2_00440 [Methanolapillus ohkumae]|uniref:Uncharacterized protein n=1 Tax=Methanolapillus ohkumae TaxID=3028298 RepID=A0AA96ZV34_9EURY|nr:hypothetical protein MsAm2_00440 [Methanosarcinaceae archaeon Am2]